MLASKYASMNSQTLVWGLVLKSLLGVIRSLLKPFTLGIAYVHTEDSVSKRHWPLCRVILCSSSAITYPHGADVDISVSLHLG